MFLFLNGQIDTVPILLLSLLFPARCNCPVILSFLRLFPSINTLLKKKVKTRDLLQKGK